MDKRTSLLEQHNIFYLNSSADDDLYKIYYIHSQLKNKWYRIIATAFGSTSCSCEEQTKNPYQNCSHMKKLDKVLRFRPKSIQTLNQIPRFILDIF